MIFHSGSFKILLKLLRKLIKLNVGGRFGLLGGEDDDVAVDAAEEDEEDDADAVDDEDFEDRTGNMPMCFKADRIGQIDGAYKSTRSFRSTK
jgi:fructose/tagatose bisphosphate aldolase